MAPDEQTRQALLEAVDWLAPDAMLSPPYSAFSNDWKEAHVLFAHPLSRIAALGDEALFRQALDRAARLPWSNCNVEIGREKVNMSDWAGAGVLDAVAAHGTVNMLDALIKELLPRKRRSLNMPMSHSGDGPMPWWAMARYGSRSDSPQVYIKKLEMLDRYVFAESRARVCYHARNAKPRKAPADGSGRVGVWEKKMRVAYHEAALSYAAKAGNFPMAQALLHMGHASISMEAIDDALDSGSGRTALLLASHPKGLASHQNLPISMEDRRGFSRVVSDKVVRIDNLLGALVSAGKSIEKWAGKGSDSPLFDVEVPALIQAGVLVLDFLGKISPAVLDKREHKKTDGHYAEKMLPLLVRLGPSEARRAAEILHLASEGGLDMAPLPTAAACAGLVEFQDSPWAHVISSHLQAMDEKSFNGYIAWLAADFAFHLADQIKAIRNGEDIKVGRPAFELASRMLARPGQPAPDLIHMALARAGLDASEVAMWQNLMIEGKVDQAAAPVRSRRL